MTTHRCISLWQPWASLVACGAKSTETRGRPVPSTILGQRIGIHAAQSVQGLKQIRGIDPWHLGMIEAMEDALQLDCGAWAAELPFMAIIATAYVEASIPTERLIPDPFGDFSPGRFGWMLADIKPLATPIPFRGSQGIFFADIPDT